MSSYTIKVLFTRELEEDADVIGVEEPSQEDLTKQFCKELQEAYDEGWISGSFQVTEVQLP